MRESVHLALRCLAASLLVATGCAGGNEGRPLADLRHARDTHPEAAQGCSVLCQGCCAGEICRAGTAVEACGHGGGPCVICAADEACVQQSCVPKGPGCDAAGCTLDAQPGDGPAGERAAHDGPRKDGPKKDRGPDLKCQDQCTLGGAPQCYGTGYHSCQSGPSGCTVWGPVTPCTSDQICSGGACKTVEYCLPKSAGQSCTSVCSSGSMTSCRYTSQTSSCEWWADCNSWVDGQGYCRCYKAP